MHCDYRYRQGGIVSRAGLAVDITEVGMPCVPLCEDGKGVIRIAQNPVTESILKHNGIRQTLSGNW